MKRMLCIISQYLLPNFIPVNEPLTRPDALHAVVTPQMQGLWDSLKTALAQQFPQLELPAPIVQDAYDARGVKERCEQLLRDFAQDEWSFNATGGTKLMSSPADETFREHGCAVYYVETPRQRILKINRDWTTEEIKFTASIDLKTYFALYGRIAQDGPPQTEQERTLYRRLSELNWKVWSSVRLSRPGVAEPLAEYDAMGISGYQLYAFESKRLKGLNGRFTEKQKDQILIDLYKLSQLQKTFGGPFGKSYWLLSSDCALSNFAQERIREFNITLVEGYAVNELSVRPQHYGLPPRRMR